jgi:hypothetical protein
MLGGKTPLDLIMGKTKDLLEGHKKHRGKERGMEPPSPHATNSINASVGGGRFHASLSKKYREFHSLGD